MKCELAGNDRVRPSGLYRGEPSPAGGCGTVEFHSRRNDSVMDRRTFISAVAAGIIAVPLVARAQTATTVRRMGVFSDGRRRLRPSWQEITRLCANSAGWRAGIYSSNSVTPTADPNSSALRGGARSAQGGDHRDGGHGGHAGGQERHDHHSYSDLRRGDPVRTGLSRALPDPAAILPAFPLLARSSKPTSRAAARVLPALQRVGVLVDSTNPYSRAMRSEFEQVCRSLGIQPIFVEVAAEGELESAIAEMARQRAQALFVPGDELFYRIAFRS